MDSRPLVAHLIYRFQIGGLEMLLAQCVNRMPANKYRHAIVCLTDFNEFSKKITRSDVEFFSLNKKPGLGLGTHVAVWRLFRRIKPTILHTYNLSALEYAVTATVAGVAIRVHAEHGRDASDPHGTNWKHNFLRRLLVPFVDMFVPVSNDLKRWFSDVIGVPSDKNLMINNGVDTNRFFPRKEKPELKSGPRFPENCFVIGTVGRIQKVKNQIGLIDAFIHLCNALPSRKKDLRLVIIGDGPLLPVLKAKVSEAGIQDLVWLPGARDDVAEIMKAFSVFAMTSIAEGTPVVILEAMASGLPVIATRIGGMPEVVTDNFNGKLVPVTDTPAFSEALSSYVLDSGLLALHGAAGRQLIVDTYSIDVMLDAYTTLYDELCAAKA